MRGTRHETHPYFFEDMDDDGKPDVDDGGKPIAYPRWSARLLRAAHKKEPGAWAHNTNYAVQLLIDAIADLGGDASAA